MGVQNRLERRLYQPQAGVTPQPAPRSGRVGQRKPDGAPGRLQAARARSDAHADPYPTRRDALRDAVPERDLETIRHGHIYPPYPHGHPYPRVYRATHCHADPDGYPLPARTADQAWACHFAQRSAGLRLAGDRQRSDDLHLGI